MTDAVSFPAGTDFEHIHCVDGELLADVLADGQRVEVVVIGLCPHCHAGDVKGELTDEL